MMKRLAAFALIGCLAFAGQAEAAFTVTHKTTNQSFTASTVTTATTIAATHIISVHGSVQFSSSGNTISSITDPAGDTFTFFQCAGGFSTRSLTFEGYALTAGLTAQSVTVTLSASPSVAEISVDDVTGGVSSGTIEDASVRQCVNGATSTSPTITGNGATVSGELNISDYGANANSTALLFVEDINWTTIVNTGNANISAASAYRSNAGTGGLTRAPTTAVAVPYAMSLIALCPSTGCTATSTAHNLGLLGVGK